MVDTVRSLNEDLEFDRIVSRSVEAEEQLRIGSSTEADLRSVDRGLITVSDGVVDSTEPSLILRVSVPCSATAVTVGSVLSVEEPSGSLIVVVVLVVTADPSESVFDFAALEALLERKLY